MAKKRVLEHKIDALKAQEKIAAAEETGATSTTKVAEKVRRTPRLSTKWRCMAISHEKDHSGLLECTVLVSVRIPVDAGWSLIETQAIIGFR